MPVQLFNQFYKSLIFFAWKLSGDQDMAKDLCQDAFVALLQKKDIDLENEYTVKSFLYTSVKFSVYNLSRKNKIIKRYWEKIQFSEHDEVDLEHLIIQSEVETNLHKELKKLPAACQKIMTLKYVEGYSNQEIAEELKLSLNTIKTQRRRGFHTLKNLINPELYVLVLLTIFF